MRPQSPSPPAKNAFSREPKTNTLISNSCAISFSLWPSARSSCKWGLLRPFLLQFPCRSRRSSLPMWLFFEQEAAGFSSYRPGGWRRITRQNTQVYPTNARKASRGGKNLRGFVQNPVEFGLSRRRGRFRRRRRPHEGWWGDSPLSGNGKGFPFEIRQGAVPARRRPRPDNLAAVGRLSDQRPGATTGWTLWRRASWPRGQSNSRRSGKAES